MVLKVVDEVQPFAFLKIGVAREREKIHLSG
jgi:hypothetical protein